MTNLTHLTTYVHLLERAFAATQRAEDRPHYQALLADAAGLLASAAAVDSAYNLACRISNHDHLLGNIWIHDSSADDIHNAWVTAKRSLSSQ